ncbi:MAG: HD domain-containing protein [Paludibacteraceae bacterium]|nr:HD domain-containing protein [Paludibacteraceae bacterium]
MDITSLQNIFFSQINARHTKEDTELIKQAYFLAKKQHEGQLRKTGEPYIIHPIAVAQIVNNDMQLGTAPVIAALLHDVVEDTNCTLADIRDQFGDEVAYLVDTVTKQPVLSNTDASKQVENFKRMLAAFNYDIRALLIKLADRLHNMRTLKSMAVEKQLKIAAETDFFYAPLANRLGLYLIKSELENLGLQYRSPFEYSIIQEHLNNYILQHTDAAEQWMEPIRKKLEESGVSATVSCDPRTVYSLWYKMHQTRASFKELEHIRIVHINYEPNSKWASNTTRDKRGVEKDTALFIYSLLTELYTEKPYSLLNYIDYPKENGYRSLHCKFMGNEGRWMEVHIQSNEMRRISQYGCLAEQSSDVDSWIEKFKEVLKDISDSSKDQNFDDVITSFYHDDIVVFASDGQRITLPADSSAIDFAYEIHSDVGDHAKYAIINDHLCAVTTILNRGDRVKIGTDENYHPQENWLKVAQTFKARANIRRYLNHAASEKIENKHPEYVLCERCHPLPGDEVVGFKSSDGTITVHKCNCDNALSLSSQRGDVITKVELEASPEKTYPIGLVIKAVNRDNYLLDIMNLISKELGLSIEEIHSTTTDEIIETQIRVLVHSISELKTLATGIQNIPNVYEVRRTKGRIL